MSIRGRAFIAGAFEHPERVIPDRTPAQIHAVNAVNQNDDVWYTRIDEADVPFARLEWDVNGP